MECARLGDGIWLFSFGNLRTGIEASIVSGDGGLAIRLLAIHIYKSLNEVEACGTKRVFNRSFEFFLLRVLLEKLVTSFLMAPRI